MHSKALFRQKSLQYKTSITKCIPNKIIIIILATRLGIHRSQQKSHQMSISKLTPHLQ